MKAFVQINESLAGISPKLPSTDLDRDHRKCEDVPFLAVCPPLVQDLRCNPSSTVTVLSFGAPDRIQVLSDHDETKVRDPRMAGGVHKDIWLDGRQYGDRTRPSGGRVPP